MSWISKISQAIQYIEDHLLDDISIENVAKRINYSPSAYQNIFSAVTGYSVGEYIRFRRLSCAVDDLAEGASITEIAFKYQYETVEAFSKAFKRLFGCSPSKYHKNQSVKQRFNPIVIEFQLKGGFGMTRNIIPNMQKVDWSDGRRQNEFVNSVVSALNALGEKLDYDFVCAVSGCAFRTSFSEPASTKWNHGNYHVIHTPIIIEHTFKMLGYSITHHNRGDYESDKQLVIDSIDKGVPVITLEGVINCSDACVISGYDNNGDVLLGYSPFMYIDDDHCEAHDDTGYFRKSNWHADFYQRGNQGGILIIEGKRDELPPDEIFAETLKIVKPLIEQKNIAPNQLNGLAAHTAFAEALQSYTWDDNSEPYLNVMCNYKQYLDRQYAVKFLDENGRSDLAEYYREVADLADTMAELIPQDFSAEEMFQDRQQLIPYCETLLRIADLEREAGSLI